MQEQPTGSVQDVWSVLSGNKDLGFSVSLDTKSILILCGSLLLVAIVIIIMVIIVKRNT